MSMKYVDEYRDPELAKRICEEIARIGEGRHLKRCTCSWAILCHVSAETLL